MTSTMIDPPENPRPSALSEPGKFCASLLDNGYRLNPSAFHRRAEPMPDLTASRLRAK